MVIFYSIAKESCYKKGDNGDYIDCVVAINVNESETTDEDYRTKRAGELRNWISEQMKIPPLFITPITKQKFMASPNKE